MSIADGVVVCDRDNKVQIVNRAATEIFDKDAKDLVGKPLVVCTEGPDQPQICQVVQAFTDTTIAPGALEPIVEQIQLGELTVRLHIAPIILNKEFLGSVMIMQDNTKQAELERMKAEFMSNVSHELRTPLTALVGFIETLRGAARDDAAARERFLAIMDRETGRMIRLVNDLLSLSRVEAEEHRRPAERVDVTALLRTVMVTQSDQARAAGVAIHRNGASLYDSTTAGGSLFAPEGTLRQALDAALSAPSGLGVAVDDGGQVAGGIRAEDVLAALEAQRAGPG